jgi:tRNA threonylcarbamoyladenosine modification (KEOPS) complex  Pcc1 subunit
MVLIVAGTCSGWRHMEHNAVFHFRDDNAEQIYHAIAPEMSGEVNARSHAECWIESGDTLVLSVGASDIGALRASLNMWLRLVNVAKEMQELISTRGGNRI